MELLDLRHPHHELRHIIGWDCLLITHLHPADMWTLLAMAEIYTLNCFLWTLVMLTAHA